MWIAPCATRTAARSRPSTIETTSKRFEESVALAHARTAAPFVVCGRVVRPKAADLEEVELDRLATEIGPEVGMGDRDQRRGTLPKALAEQLRHAPFGDHGPDVGAGRDDPGTLAQMVDDSRQSAA